MRLPHAWRIGVLSLGLSLATAAAAGGAETIVIDGSSGVMPLATALAKAYQARQPAVTIEMGKGLGTRARLEALAGGKIDIALASHGLVVEELARRGMAAREIARVAVVFGVHAGVPVTNLTEPQVCEIYAGRLTSWRALGGPDLAVAPRTRPDTEVDAEVARAKLGCLRGLQMPASVQVMPRSGDMARALAATPGAIGMTTMTVVEQSQGQVKAVSLDGVAPSAENVRSGAYALTRDSVFVTRAPAPPAVARFLEFVRSPAGEAVIAANGAVPAK